ncbi:hypothetical protein BaRGS_00028323, partial [Batillaria attramentaria]
MYKKQANTLSKSVSENEWTEGGVWVEFKGHYFLRVSFTVKPLVVSLGGWLGLCVVGE